MKARVEVLKKYFSQIIELCDLQKGSPEFIGSLKTVINPKAIPVSPDESVLADAFYDQIKDQVQREGIGELDSLLRKYSTIENVKQLGLFINELNLHCSSFLVIKNRLLLFKINGYPIITNTKTQEVFYTMPPEYTVTTEPFQLIVDNMIGVAKATSESINSWHQSIMKLKNQYLELYTTRTVLLIQTSAIIMAVALSAFFLVANDPLNLYKENGSLKREKIELEQKNQALEQQLQSKKQPQVKVP
ncbi:MAG: hypothetical protein COV75_02645 [Candidatus Omnitrophica bacterium CG11_big_fil_rev_8_21_14_0_20_63_9]|nr:MAG: hypothetical protein COV75_02645 [Candidatus Omnitrophica bacterium CG11_big_fil_rev_8_21_14_0_20_63_9]